MSISTRGCGSHTKVPLGFSDLLSDSLLAFRYGFTVLRRPGTPSWKCIGEALSAMGGRRLQTGGPTAGRQASKHAKRPLRQATGCPSPSFSRDTTTGRSGLESIPEVIPELASESLCVSTGTVISHSFPVRSRIARSSSSTLSASARRCRPQLIFGAIHAAE